MRLWLVSLFEQLVAFFAWGFFFAVIALLLVSDVHTPPADTAGRVRQYLRGIEFDFVSWTVTAAGAKSAHAGVSEQGLLAEAERSRLVIEYFDLRRDLEAVERDISRAFTDPDVPDALAATAELRARETHLRHELSLRQSQAEAILEEQLSVILHEQGLTMAGQPLPPVSFNITPLPYALIVSPREKIRQDVNTVVDGLLTLEERVELETAITDDLDVSTLTVPLGGIGTYPTMIGQSSDLNWIASVVAHEWLHNYWTLRPLGANYLASPALRTMNETAAEMMGDELGALLMARYYPDLARPEAPFRNYLRRDAAPPPDQPPGFDFRAEMHETRITADALLADGRVDEAEAYMEARRRFLWDNGYQIRKLNQAYFAFYGAYAAGGGGAAGVDPVSAAVRLLRRRSPSIQAFVDTMAWFWRFDQLERHLGLPAS